MRCAECFLVTVMKNWHCTAIALVFPPAQKYGINLRAVYCPNCGKKQSRVRTPRDYEEAMLGGSTCPECGTRMNKYGQKKDGKG